MHSVRFELTHPKISELESDALDHSATNAIYSFVLRLLSSLSLGGQYTFTSVALFGISKDARSKTGKFPWFFLL